MGLAPFFSFGKACRLYPLDRDSGTGRWDIGLRPHTGQKVLVEQGWERSGGWGGARRGLRGVGLDRSGREWGGERGRLLVEEGVEEAEVGGGYCGG